MKIVNQNTNPLLLATIMIDWCQIAPLQPKHKGGPNDIALEINDGYSPEVFLDYFRGNDHQIINSFLVFCRKRSDSMFINSGHGSAQALTSTGQAKPPDPCLTNVQDCIRFVDAESVGDSYHGT